MTRTLFRFLCCGLTALTVCPPSVAQGKDVYQFSKDGKEIRSTAGNRFISGVYPHLTTYAHGRANGTYSFGDECGIGAIVPWYGKLYMVNYAAHRPQGSEHKLYIIDKDKKMTIFPGSVGGTPAARMIHQETNQLLIGHYLIDKNGTIRTIPIGQMPGRITAIARHLTDPANMVYYYDMEGMLYEANVRTLAVRKLYNNPLPGWHGKGAYTAQGRLVLANNGEAGENPKEWQVPVDEQKGPEKYGVLAEYDGKAFRVVERKQFTDVTTRHGIWAVSDDNSPLWTMGWDKRAIRLKVMEDGKWTTYLLPKATYNNDPSHGWFTEWPRIREVGGGDYLMDMHGMFYDFPATFSSKSSAGIRPISSHLRYIPDFCEWNGQLVLATDEVSIQGNILSGQPQSNLWFGSKKELRNWGPASGYGAIWLNDDVKAGSLSDPYLFAGFANRMAHIINHADRAMDFVVQIDEKGDNQWRNYRTFRVEGNSYLPFVFPKTLTGEWVRLRALGSGKVSFILHYTDDRYIDGKRNEDYFAGLAKVDEPGEVLAGKLYTNRSNYNLSCFSDVLKDGKKVKTGKYEFRKYTFDFAEGISDTLARRALDTRVHFSEKQQFDAVESAPEERQQLWTVDEASVVLHTSKGRLRLPKGDDAFDKQTGARCIREIESEREMANIHGTFYELPLLYVGQEPLFKMMRPVASHTYCIDDFNTWNGLLTFTGIRRDASPSNAIHMNADKSVALWFGSIEDIWKMGKPTGKGGPWKNTDVKAGQMSDPYLMTGYDKKTLTLKADKDVNVTLWLSVSHYLNEPVRYKTFSLKAGQELVYRFPEGFSAHWAYVQADRNCRATAQFVYE